MVEDVITNEIKEEQSYVIAVAKVLLAVLLLLTTTKITRHDYIHKSVIFLCRFTVGSLYDDSCNPMFDTCVCEANLNCGPDDVCICDPAHYEWYEPAKMCGKLTITNE